MHSVFFGWKRTHWATMNFFRDVLVRAGVTANRYDVLLFLHHRRDNIPLTQRDLRAVFGVARATMSETLRRLATLGFITRERAPDARTYTITLTERGRAAIDHARCMLKRLVRRTLAKIFRSSNPVMLLHDDIDEHLHTRRVLGDTAVRELVDLWHPDD